MLKSLIKSVIHFLGSSGSFLSLMKGQGSLVLNYHHIVLDDMMDGSLLFGYAHAVKSFDKQMEFLTKRLTPSLTPNAENSFLITFDDCSKSTIRHAIPILDKYGIKAKFFVVESSLEKTLWIDDYFMWCSYVPSGTYTVLGTTFQIATKRNRMSMHHALWQKYRDGIPADKILGSMNEAYGFDRFQVEKRKKAGRLQCLGVDDIEMLKSKGHEVGFHSQTHQRLSGCDRIVLQAEITTQNPDLYSTNDFAIPFGSEDDYNEEVLTALLNASKGDIYLNHAAVPSSRVYGRLNLPDSNSNATIKFHIRQYLKSIR